MFRFAQSKICLAALTGAISLSLVLPAVAQGPSQWMQQPAFTPRNAPLFYSPRVYSSRASFASYSPRPYSVSPSYSSFSSAPTYSARPFDGGGNVLEYYANSRSADSGYGHTVIAGVCASACTMKLGERNACVEPDATLMFHEASASGFRSELATRIMLDAYPSGIRSWAVRSGAMNSNALTELSGRQAIALGVHSCQA